MISEKLKNLIIEDFNKNIKHLKKKVENHRKDKKANILVLSFISHQYKPCSVEYDYNLDKFTQIYLLLENEDKLVYIKIP